MPSVVTRTILAGEEDGDPADSPVARLDADNQYPFVGGVSMRLGARSSTGSGVALSEEWVLTAGHNADFNDDGLGDAGMLMTFHLPAHGSFAVSEVHTHPDFAGFASPTLNDDLALLRLASPLPNGFSYPTLGPALVTGEEVVLVGFGRSGFGDRGFRTASGVTDRRFGSNVIDILSPDDDGGSHLELFRYDFDDESTTGELGGSLGNGIETMIGPGDSGGPALRVTSDGWDLVGINTFTQGRGGRFGDTGGGVVLAPYEGWIQGVTGIPEPGVGIMMSLAMILILLRRRVVRVRAVARSTNDSDSCRDLTPDGI